MRQLALPLAPPPQPTLGNFVPGRNSEVLALWSSLAGGDESERFIYIWGSPGSGKTHLLRAMYSELCGRDVAAAMFRSDDSSWDRPPDHVVLVDDVEQLDAEAQV